MPAYAIALLVGPKSRVNTSMPSLDKGLPRCCTDGTDARSVCVKIEQPRTCVWRAISRGSSEPAPHTSNGCKVCVWNARVFVLCYGCTVKGVAGGVVDMAARAAAHGVDVALWPWCEIVAADARV